MDTSLPADAPQPRLCHLTKWPDFDGFGFNLQLGQFIGKVDDDSPAQHAQLREGDRIIEVNEVNIANENHRQVVERIKVVANETRLLVLDRAADRYYRERNWQVHGKQSNVLYCKTPNPRPPSITVQNNTITSTTITTTNDTASHMIQSDQDQSKSFARPAIVEQPHQQATVTIEPVSMNEHVVHPQQVEIHVSESTESDEKEPPQTSSVQTKETKLESTQNSEQPQSNEINVKAIATAKVNEVIEQAQARVQSSTGSVEQSIREDQLKKKDSLVLPIDNQQTIQAVVEAAGEQLNSLKLIVNSDSQTSESQKLEAHSTGNGNLNPNSPIKHHHNFIVINSEEQFAHERKQQEQQQQQQQQQQKQLQSPSVTNQVVDCEPVRQHSRTNGSIGSELSHSSQGSEHSQNSLNTTTTNNNNSSTMDLNLNMSASEMRKMLSQRKNRKIEAKKAQLDLRQKYEIIQHM